MALKKYILESMINQKAGLYLCEFPTGIGKTYTVVQAMRDYVLDETKEGVKLIYLTPLNKNLPEEELLKAFGNDIELYNKKVLRIRSNFDEIVDKIENIKIPKKFKNDDYFDLKRKINEYKYKKDKAKRNETEKENKYYNEKANEKDIKKLEEEIRKLEKNFRNNIENTLKEEFKTKTDRLEAIHNNKEWKWVGELYPAVFTDEHQILLMSVSKFMKKNSTIIEPSYSFLKKMVDNTIIFLDEFDSTKMTIKNDIVEKAASITEEYISLFIKISKGLNLDDFTDDFIISCSRHSFENVLNETKAIKEKYFTNLSYKTKENAGSGKQNFLFKDANYHTIFQNKEKKNYIRARLNNNTNRIEIFFEKSDDFKKNLSDDDINIFGLLRAINRYLRHFKYFVMEWSKRYMKLVNKRRKSTDDEFSQENALRSIFHKLQISEYLDLIMGDFCYPETKLGKKGLFPDNSFYQQGIEVFSLKDSANHHDNTNLMLNEIKDTPEKILVYLSERATVFGVSATAEENTVVGNYNLEYVSEKLRSSFHLTPDYLKKAIEEKLKKSWKPYENGEIKIHTKVIKEKYQTQCINEIQNNLNEEFETGHEFITEYCTNLFAYYSENNGRRKLKDFEINCYCKLLIAMYDFLKKDNLQALLYLGMALPKKSFPRFDIDLITDLFDYLKKIFSCPQAEVVTLRSKNFDDDKKKLIEDLEKGEKRFIISTYNTIGAGQNLQYKAPDKSKLVKLTTSSDEDEKDPRYQYKDIDALYLADITHLAVNVHGDNKFTKQDLFQMLFQIEETKYNGEINYKQSTDLIKMAFSAYAKKVYSEHNPFYGKGRHSLYDAKSIRLQANRHVMQAVGRMCRTFLKNPDINIYIEEKLLSILDTGEFEKHILSPEMKEIVRLRKELGTDVSKEKQYILNKAEDVSSRGKFTINSFLSSDWTEFTIPQWEGMREFALRYPGTSKEEKESFDDDEYEISNDFYITSGKKQNTYLYSQNNDYGDVVIDFDNDKFAFENSKRVKKDGKGKALIYEMSEENSGLPIALKYPGMREYFKKNGFATEFKKNDYMMSPIFYNNIYKGALGEYAGKFILERELSIELLPITDPEKYEFFDFELAPDVYIDFKNWKFNFFRDRESIKHKIYTKMDAIGAKRAYIINLIGDENMFTPTKTIDGRLIEIPGLIDQDGNVLIKNLKMIEV